MKTMLALVLAVAACGGSSKPATTPAPEPAPAAEATASTEPAPAPASGSQPAPPAEPAPAPLPTPAPPTFDGWWASADASVLLTQDGKATVENKKKKATKKGSWDSAGATLTVDKKATPLKLDGEQLVVTVGGAEQKLWRQPTTFDGTTFANDNGSIQLNADGTCIHGQAGMPAMCTFKLEGGKLAITYAKEAKKKPVTWAVWFENGGKTLHTPKETFTATGG